MATLVQRIIDLAIRSATEDKLIKTMVNGNVGDLSALNTAFKTHLVGAINELVAEVGAMDPGAVIDDGAIALDTTYSSSKIEDLVQAAIDAVTNGAPGALDTLDELANALGDDANFAATITTALSKRLRFDAAQALTAPEKAQGNANLGSAALVDTGVLDTNFVTQFESAL